MNNLHLSTALTALGRQAKAGYRAYRSIAEAPYAGFRKLTLLLAFYLAWAFVLEPCALAMSGRGAERVIAQPMSLLEMQKLSQAAKQAQQRQAALQATIRAAQVPKPMHLTLPHGKGDVLPDTHPLPADARPADKPSPTLLDEVGLLAHPVAPAQVAAWRSELKTAHPVAARKALLHLWLGEWELGYNEQPRLADWHLCQTQHLTAHRDLLHGLATYDRAIALYYTGSYDGATDAFLRLITPRTMLGGYPHNQCALWMRHASACAGYHADHARLGIPEPPSLDPNCGAAALAACLRSLSLPWDYKGVLSVCHVGGEGSSLADIIAAQKKLPVSIRALTADDEGIRTLPKPLVAYVEHDHFVAVVRADKKGVSYLCSDCGAWPGGGVHLTWAQWHTMNPGLYAAVTKRGSRWDRVLATHLVGETAKVRVAMLPSLGLPKMSRPELPLLSTILGLRGVHIYTGSSQAVACLAKYQSTRCQECKICCPKDKNGPGGTKGGGGGSKGGGRGPTKTGSSAGDPVNLATGEEEYEPDADISVYNPRGPSVSWGRIYDSLGNMQGGDGYSGPVNAGLQELDYGQGWSQTYNVGVFDSGGRKYVIFPNGSRIEFTTPSAPDTTTPSVPCTVETGVPLLVNWEMDSNDDGSHFTVTFADRTRWVMGSTITSNSLYPLAQMVDRNGNAINFQYIQFGQNTVLSAILDGSNKPLLTVLRDGFGRIAAVSDRYGRSVYYHVGAYYSYKANGDELDEVSQIVPTATANPPDRYLYGYQYPALSNNTQALFLHTITVPSPTGSGQSTSTINYDQNQFVSSLVDANGNVRFYTSVDETGQQAYPSTHTLVTVKDPSGNLSYSYTASYDNNMSSTAETDGGRRTTSSSTYDTTSPDPYRPTSVTDGNGNTTQYTWDQYGNLLSSTPPHNANRTPATTTYHYDYSNFALGERANVQVGTKTATVYTYYEPSGLIESINSPLPGTAGTALPSTPTYAYQYNDYGDITTVTSRGNNATGTSTTTYNYTSDLGDPAHGIPAYSQPAAINQAVSIVDNLSHVTHIRYDAQDNKVVEIDALGNETDRQYNVANQLLVVTYPATGQTGTGHAKDVSSYLYLDGPILTDAKYDESSRQVRQVQLTYGAEGELLSQVGDGQPEYMTYDALYRPVAFADGKGQTTQFTFNQYGYLATETYPNGDQLKCTSYDVNGNLLTKIDGRGVETDYAYADPESRLTDITYPSTPALNVHMHYDGYGRVDAKTDGAGSYSSAYDDLDRLSSATTTYTNVPAQTISYAYYPDGSYKSLTTPAGLFQYAYDGAGRLATLTNPFGETSSWDYLDNNWLSGQNSGGVLTAAYTHNARGVITDLTNRKTDVNASKLSEFSNIQSDSVGNLLSVTSTIATMPSYDGTTSYAYDDKNEMTGEQGTGADSYTNSFGYDGAGNPTTYKNRSNSFNSANQNVANTYDGAGNPTTYKGTVLSFDAENRMVQYGTAMTCGYRGDSLRAWKQNNSNKTYFLYFGHIPVCELNENGTVTATNTFGAAGLVSRHTSLGSVFYAFDIHGSAVQRLDGNGNVLSSQMFDAYGSRLSTDNDADPYSGFGGQNGYYTDWEIGDTSTALELLTFRFYDPNSGQFLNRDPLGYRGGANPYEYVDDTPTIKSDPLGLAPFEPPIGGAIAGCLLAIIGNTKNVEDCEKDYNQCKQIGGCIANILAAGLGAGLVAVCPAAAPISGCFEGIAAMLLNMAVDAICKPKLPCPDPNEEGDGCKIAGAITDMVLSCISGLLGSKLDDLEGLETAGKNLLDGVINSLAGFLGLGIDMACESNQKT